MKNGFMLTRDEVLGIYKELEVIVTAVQGEPETTKTLAIKGSCARILETLKPEKEERER